MAARGQSHSRTDAGCDLGRTFIPCVGDHVTIRIVRSRAVKCYTGGTACAGYVLIRSIVGNQRRDRTASRDLKDGAVTIRAALIGGAVEVAVASRDQIALSTDAIRTIVAMQGRERAGRRDPEDGTVTIDAALI